MAAVEVARCTGQVNSCSNFVWQVATAVAAWRLVLCGRFRLLDRFCGFVISNHKSTVILEDTWRQVSSWQSLVLEA